jgi:multisubunit Na+/H+ antiporter MnhB subunit
MKGMTVIVKSVTRWVTLFIVLYGAYITLTGHLSPGGGFAGGVIIACAYILLILAFGREAGLGRVGLRTAAGLDSAGALIFLTVGLLGVGWGGVFFANFLQEHFPGKSFHILSAGTIPLNNIAICLKVSASLFAIFVILSVLRIVVDADGTSRMVQKEEEE